MKMHHIGISVRDLEQSVKFYTELFGFKEKIRYTKKERNGSATILQLRTMQLELFNFNRNKKSKDDSADLHVIGLKHIAFKVDDIGKKYNEFKSKGIIISKPVKGITCSKFCFLKDPDGISIELYEK